MYLSIQDWTILWTSSRPSYAEWTECVFVQWYEEWYSSIESIDQEKNKIILKKKERKASKEEVISLYVRRRALLDMWENTKEIDKEIEEKKKEIEKKADEEIKEFDFETVDIDEFNLQCMKEKWHFFIWNVSENWEKKIFHSSELWIDNIDYNRKRGDMLFSSAEEAEAAWFEMKKEEKSVEETDEKQ